MFPLVVDIYEPDSIKDMLAQLTMLIPKNNEPNQLADYYWNTGDYIIQIERKKARELLSTMWGKLDHQLIKYKQARPDSMIIILQEGLITSSPKGNCKLWKSRKLNTLSTSALFEVYTVPIPYINYRNYLHQRMIQEGIFTIQTLDETDTAITIAAFVNSSMSNNHSGLTQYKSGHADPTSKMKGPNKAYMEVLMALKGIGEKMATEMLVNMGTPWDIYRLDHETLTQMFNKRTANIIHKGIGRIEP